MIPLLRRAHSFSPAILSVFIVVALLGSDLRPVYAAVNDTISVTAKKRDIPPGSPTEIDPGDIEGFFTKAPNGFTDEIHVTNDRVKGKAAGVYNDPFYDGAMLTIVQESGPVIVSVDGREGIGAVYWVEVVPEKDGKGKAGKRPELVADVGDVKVTLVLQDNIGGESVLDKTNTDADTPLLACSAIDGRGSVDFWIELDSGGPPYSEFTWVITQGTRAYPAGLLNAGNGWRDGMDDLEAGTYQLVAFNAQVRRRTDFVIPGGNLTAHRPQHGKGYAPFAKTPVDDKDEEDTKKGPGIRINNPGDVDPDTEDDLIEVLVTREPATAELVLVRDTQALKVWKNRDKTGPISFTNDKTDPLPFAAGSKTLTVWVEWAEAQHGTGGLELSPAAGGDALDKLVFHAFRGIVVALSGEFQVPTDPPGPDDGTNAIAVMLYRAGFDVHMADEDLVPPAGDGVVYDEVFTAIRHRAVADVAAIGYSHGGGSLLGLCANLDANRAGIGAFNIVLTSYVDAIQDRTILPERQRPPGSKFHMNQYQVFNRRTPGDYIRPLFGGRTRRLLPGDFQLNVETMAWGANATHQTIDNLPQVMDAVRGGVEAKTRRQALGSNEFRLAVGHCGYPLPMRQCNQRSPFSTVPIKQAHRCKPKLSCCF